MSNRMRYGTVAGVAAIVVVVLGIVYFIMGSRSDSPENAIKMIVKSISEHDQVKFNKYVDLDTLLNTSYDGFVEGMMNSDDSMSEEVKDHVVNFTQMLKAPMTLSLKTAIENYVATGSFADKEQASKSKTHQDENVLIVAETLDRMGLNKLEFRKVEKVIINKDNKNQAMVTINVYQKEVAKEFTFEFMLTKQKSGEWRVVSIRNFRDFVEMVNQNRREQLNKYLEDTEEIINSHNKTIQEAEQKYSNIISNGNLSKDSTRGELQNLMANVIKKDWEARKQELFNINVPKGAEALQNLRIKICDLSIESAELYAKWMSDKKAATVKAADSKRKQVKALAEEEKVLTLRISK